MVTPVNSTYTTKNIPLVSQIDSRGPYNSLGDGYIENFIPNLVKNSVTNENELTLIKRQPLQTISEITGAVGQARGFFYWQDQDKFVVAISRNIYIVNRATGNVITTFVNAVDNNDFTPVGFSLYLTSTGIQSVIFTDGTTLSQVSTTNVLTICTDVDLPVPHLPTPVYFDGYLLLVKANTADCYNSDLDAPLSWTPGNFITAEKSPDVVTGITTLNDFFILLGSNSIEYFYNQGNPTGTPFQRSDTFIKLTGYYGGLAKYGNTVFFIGESDQGSFDVFHLENYKITSIGNNSIRRYLSANQTTLGFTGGIVSLNGTTLYLLRSGGVNTGLDPYYFDTNTGLWGLIKTNIGLGNFAFINTQPSHFSPFTSYLMFNQSTAILGFVYEFFGIYGDKKTVGFSNGTAYTGTIVTDKFNFGTTNQKFMHGLTLVPDRNDAFFINNPIDVSVSDDDGRTYSTPRSLELNQERANLQQLGRFRNRSIKLVHTGLAPCKLYGMEADLNMGIT